MDESLEQPSSSVLQVNRVEGEDDSGEDEDVPDWTKLSKFARSSATSSKPIIPKRGEKDFEPSGGTGDGSALQKHNLNASRSAMFDALRGERVISSKALSHAVWYPNICRAEVTVPRGLHFSTMGNSVLRPDRPGKRLELLPEETLYLIDRGSLMCHKASATGGANEPMSVQQAYAEMVGPSSLTMERYLVYAYLKRLGYTVIRARIPDHICPPPSITAHDILHSSFLSRLVNGLYLTLRRVLKIFSRSVDWWRPRIWHGWRAPKSYESLFARLRFLASSYNVNICEADEIVSQDNPYDVFYHIYKPITPFKKTAPPPPDFHVAVVNARTTNMPSIDEFLRLFEGLPRQQPPLPRFKHSAPKEQSVSRTQRIYRRFLSWIFFWRPLEPARKPNPFAVLKAGTKTVVMAVVDSGTISFYRFSQGAFADWPMM